jgi:hypothetical protein
MPILILLISKLVSPNRSFLRRFSHQHCMCFFSQEIAVIAVVYITRHTVQTSSQLFRGYYVLALCITILLQKLTGSHLVKKFSTLYGTLLFLSSLPRLQVPATCPYPEPDQCSPYPQLTS